MTNVSLVEAVRARRARLVELRAEIATIEAELREAGLEVTGMASKGTQRRHGLSSDILVLLREHKAPMRAKDIATAIGHSQYKTATQLSQMHGRRLIARVGVGMYQAMPAVAA